MKKRLIFLVILLSLASAARAQVRIDLKTPWKEKHRLGPLAAEVAVSLEWLGYRIVEAGEDYAVWLRSYSECRLERGRSLARLQVVAARPCAFQMRGVLAWRDLAFPLRYRDVGHGGRSGPRMGKWRRHGDRDRPSADRLGARIASEIDAMISELEDRNW